MKMLEKHRASWVITALTALSGVAAIAFVGPTTEVAIHWNAAGEPNGYSTAFPAFFIPLLPQFFITLLFANLHLLEPRKENLEHSKDLLEIIGFGICVMLASTQGLMIADSFGYQTDVSFIFLFVGTLIAILGNYMGKLKSTFTVGIRTPWTLSSDDVWRKTHRFGGKLFMAAGLIVAVGSLILPPETQFTLMMVTILPATLIPIVYSWMLWRKEQTN